MRALLGLACLTALALPACTLATASSGFEEYGGPLRCGESGPARDLVVNLTSFSAHSMNTLTGDVVRIGDSGSRTVVARFVLDPGRISDPTVVMPCALGAGQYELDLLADIDNSGTVSCPPLPESDPTMCFDHQWRLEIQADGTLNYMHDLRFEDLAVDPATPDPSARTLDVAIRNWGDFEGLPMEVHVRRIVATAAERETVYVHRLGALPPVSAVLGGTLVLPRVGTIATPALNLSLPESEYEIVFWIDTNMNGTYEFPSPGRSGRDTAFKTNANFDVDGVHAVFDFTSAEAVPVDVRL